MTEYSQFLVFFLLLPVLSQIILPLGMSIGYVFYRAIMLGFTRQEKVVHTLKDDVLKKPIMQN